MSITQTNRPIWLEYKSQTVNKIPSEINIALYKTLLSHLLVVCVCVCVCLCLCAHTDTHTHMDIQVQSNRVCQGLAHKNTTMS